MWKWRRTNHRTSCSWAGGPQAQHGGCPGARRTGWRAEPYTLRTERGHVVGGGASTCTAMLRQPGPIRAEAAPALGRDVDPYSRSAMGLLRRT